VFSVQDENQFRAALNGRMEAAAVASRRSNESSSSLDLDVEAVLTHHKTPVCNCRCFLFSLAIQLRSVPKQCFNVQMILSMCTVYRVS